MPKCKCPQTPITRYYLLLAISFFSLATSFWGIDWSFSKQASGEPVEIMGYTMSASAWYNLNWGLMFFSVVLIVVTSIKIGCLKCRGEL
jgi:hypothetical protein